MSKQIRYEVGIGSSCATGFIFVEDNATDEDIRLAIMDNLYYVEYEVIDEKRGNTK